MSIRGRLELVRDGGEFFTGPNRQKSRYILIESGEFTTPFWVRLDEADHAVTSLPWRVQTKSMNIEIFINDPVQAARVTAPKLVMPAPRVVSAQTGTVIRIALVASLKIVAPPVVVEPGNPTAFGPAFESLAEGFGAQGTVA